ncbi:glycerol kinase 2 [Capsaspora owczarzaki ATCC 30864]|uniref:Probable glycerol kinase n=1 Tax=Capsaspora owczarzaki (strain ATCC 30864) TaxID=595528 RepID=A0A0D2WM79_CAPO3|nr:glycerol kinase 2 [Capsaspora owczarzaki ATCC 30864]KJE91890.1 glycerol kinase 2 [Capsaspora owczarzaki ATCC 30864]|eukprot:XP_004363793.1 glycerol kinase 2 [Capsaspora owczarzaki ATCC 30864]
MAAAAKSLLIGAIDQGTSSTRFIVFDLATSRVIAQSQVLFDTLTRPGGWSELNPMAILDTVRTCMAETATQLEKRGFSPKSVQAIGVTNQRESTVVWDRVNGQPLYNAILWLDSRTTSTVERLIQATPSKSKDHFRAKAGLPLASYFSAVKLRWLIDNEPPIRQAIEAGRCMFGTVDSWLLWNLTGGVKGGQHVTDVTNASRTMLMNLHSMQWDDELCAFFGVPKSILPKICSSAEVYGKIAEGQYQGISLSGCLGDQQAALVGQQCFSPGEAKNTYGTGCFMLYNTGTTPVQSKSGLLTTVAYKFGEQPAAYALEGSISIAGAAVNWLRDKMKIITKSDQMSALAAEVPDTDHVYFVPAFSGLYAPHWREDARGVIVGITANTNRAHLARATLEAVCFQTREILLAMTRDCGCPLLSLRVDGGMTKNDVLMQTQADLLGISVVRPAMAETTALGAAIAAAVGIGAWDPATNQIQQEKTIFHDTIDQADRDRRFKRWHEAVDRSVGWHVPEGTATPGGIDRSVDSTQPTLREKIELYSAIAIPVAISSAVATVVVMKLLSKL